MTRNEAVEWITEISMLIGTTGVEHLGIEAGEKMREAINTLVKPRNTFTIIDAKTGVEADTYEIALHEEWAKELMFCDMDGFAILEDGTLILVDECGRCEYVQDTERFKVVWDD